MKADDRDAILWTGSIQKIARRFADEVDPLFHAARYIQQQHQIERFSRRGDVDDLPLTAVLVNRKIGVAHSRNRAAIAIGDAGVDAHQLRSNGSNHLAGRAHS